MDQFLGLNHQFRLFSEGALVTRRMSRRAPSTDEAKPGGEGDTARAPAWLCLSTSVAPHRHPLPCDSSQDGGTKGSRVFQTGVQGWGGGLEASDSSCTRGPPWLPSHDLWPCPQISSILAVTRPAQGWDP